MGGRASKVNLDITGHRYGRLIVKSYLGRFLKHSLWACICDCGAEVGIRLSNLRNGHTKSCGCFLEQSRKSTDNKHTTHKHTLNGKRSPTYQSWRCMRERCIYPSNASYHNYGAMGIKVCDRWQLFKNFLEDMGERPEGKTIDRIDPKGNYEPSNCRWATWSEQNKNKRKTYERT